MKKTIENYLFITDAFGPMPVWSLMHPLKESNDAYQIPYEAFKNKPLWFLQLKEINKYFEKLDKSKYLCAGEDILIDGVIEYHYDKKYGCRVIDGLVIKWFYIEGGISEKGKR